MHFDEDIDQVSEKRYRVLGISYHVHTKKDAEEGDPKTLRVAYRVNGGKWISEWICFEHLGVARLKAKKWWRSRSKRPVPIKADRALRCIKSVGIAASRFITVRSSAHNPFPEIISHELPPAFLDVDEGGVE